MSVSKLDIEGFVSSLPIESDTQNPEKKQLKLVLMQVFSIKDDPEGDKSPERHDKSPGSSCFGESFEKSVHLRKEWKGI